MDYFAQIIINGILLGAIYALISIGLNLIFGVIKIVNFAHGEFLMIGMYLTFLLFSRAGMDPYLSIPLVFACLFILGIIIHKIILQPLLGKAEFNILLATAGLGIVFQNLALMIFKSDYRVIQTSYSSEKIRLFGTLISVSRLGAFIVAIVVVAIMYYLLMKTRLGTDIRAISQDSEAAILMGINDKKIFAITFGLGVGLVGIAAAIITPIYYIFPTVGESFSTISFIVVVLGGLGSFHGALIGGLIIGIVEAVGGIISSAELARVFSLLIFLIILFVKPSGIMGKNARA